MKTGLHQQQGLRQELRINPRLYQAMDMLYMPMLDLQQHLQQELLNNPFLELEEPEEEETPEKTTEQEQEEVKKDDEVDWEEILLNGFEVGGPKEQFEVMDYIEPVSVESRDLADHLRDQLQMLDMTPRMRLLCEELIGNINDDGLLGCPLEVVLESANLWLLSNNPAARAPEPEEVDPFDLDEDEAEDDHHGAPHTNGAAKLPPGVAVFTAEELDAALIIIQSLDPPGVGARNLRECLLLQLREHGDADTLTYRLVDQAFEDLIAHRWNDLARKFGVGPREAQSAADVLARCDAKPGLKYADRGDAYITPDLIVDKIEGRYQVFLNDTGVPRLRLSRSYQEIAREKGKMTAENRDFIASRMNSATWMIQAIEQRRQTMLKVMNFIVDRQREFFEKGVEYLRPLTLREVAEVISMHESTVSRVTNEKFVQTPRGVLPLKFFFSSALQTASGEDASARSIRAKLEKMVAEESAAKPLTDQQIVHLFEEQGIQIARRTVAKYRDQLGILPARMRKRV
ncbi:MAG: RNA polymerase factor sigma-54 [Gemmatimonadales bacterium]